MLEAKQSTYPEYSLDLSVPDTVKDRVKRTIGELMYLVTPEDTADGVNRLGKNDLLSVAKSESGSVVKTIFWIALSVGVTVLLGQLH